MLIVPLTSADADVAAAIHAASFPAPWTADDFAVFLAQPGVHGWVGGRAHAPEGFILMRRAVEEAEILTLAVDPAARGHGVGRAILDHAIEALRVRGCAACFLEVAVTNTPARALYAAAGFVPCGKRKAYYDVGAGAQRDALIMRRDV
jgi:ribosomal-protein-alanine N-acetyltransferase